MAYTVISDFVLDQLLGYQTMTSLKDNIVALAGRRANYSLGGSMEDGQRSAAAVEVPNYIDVELDGTNLGGFTKQARIECKVGNTTTSNTPRVLNVTDTTVAGTGSAMNSVTRTAQAALALTVASGVKKYRLQHTGSNADDDIFSIGYIEVFA